MSLATLCLVLFGCGASAEPALLHLADGTEIDVAADGAVTVRRDGHLVLAVANRGPESASFTLTHRELSSSAE